MKLYYIFALVCLAKENSAVSYPPSEFALIWSDEFEGTSINHHNWAFENGDGSHIILEDGSTLKGWGNGEKQTYTPNNAYVSNGSLKITVKRDPLLGWTSSKLITLNKRHLKYGRVDVRLKLSKASDGVFPAVWMLPVAKSYGQWPKSGEIDIMEFQSAWNEGGPNRIKETVIHATPDGKQAIFRSSSKQINPEEYHVYTMIWEPNYIFQLVDGVEVNTYGKPTQEQFGWPFDREFYFIINHAMEPYWGSKVPDSMQENTLEIDWIRVSGRRI